MRDFQFSVFLDPSRPAGSCCEVKVTSRTGYARVLGTSSIDEVPDLMRREVLRAIEHAQAEVTAALGVLDDVAADESAPPARRPTIDLTELARSGMPAEAGG